MWKSFGSANSTSMPTLLLSWSTERREFKWILSNILRDCHRVSNANSSFSFAKKWISLNNEMNTTLPQTFSNLCLSFQTSSRLFHSNHFSICNVPKKLDKLLCYVSPKNVCASRISDNFRNPTLVGDVQKRNCIILCSSLSNWFGKQRQVCLELRIPFLLREVSDTSPKRFKPNVLQLMTHYDTRDSILFIHPSINELHISILIRTSFIQVVSFQNWDKCSAQHFSHGFPENNTSRSREMMDLKLYTYLPRATFQKQLVRFLQAAIRDLRKLTYENVALCLTKPRLHPLAETSEPELEEFWRWYCGLVPSAS